MGAVVNSRQKGKRGELEWAVFLRGHGYAARRGQQYNGLGGEDVVAEDLPGLHFEVKRTERFPHEAVDQAARDAGGRVPVVAWRRNRGPWLVILRAEDALPMFETQRAEAPAKGKMQ